MNKSLKLGLFAIAPAIALTALASCSLRPYNSGGSFELTVWESRENRDMIIELCDEFISQYEAKYPSLEGAITINFVAQEEGASINNLNTFASSGNGGDVIAFVNDTLLTGVDNLLLDPLDKFTPLMEGIVNEDAVEAFTVTSADGISDMYAYPYAQETNIIIYLKDELDESDVESRASLKEANAKVLFDLGIAQNTNGGYYFKQFLTDSKIFKDDNGEVSNDGRDFEIVTEENINNIVSFYSNYKDIVENDIVNNALTRLTSTGEFHVNAVITTPYNYNVLNRNEDLNGKLGIAPLPMLDNNVTPEPFNGYKAYGVSRYSANPALAHELAYFLSTNVSALQRRAENGVNPVLSDEYYAENATMTAALRRAVSNNECCQIVTESIDNGEVMPSVSSFADYWATMNKCCSDLWALETYTSDNVRQILNEAQEATRS